MINKEGTLIDQGGLRGEPKRLRPDEEEFVPEIDGVDADSLTGWKRELFLAWQKFEKTLTSGSQQNNFAYFSQRAFFERNPASLALSTILYRAFPDKTSRAYRIGLALERRRSRDDRAGIEELIKRALLWLDDEGKEKPEYQVRFRTTKR